MSEWYYSASDGAKGPVPAAEIVRLLNSGAITRQTPVWKEGMSGWAPLATVDELANPKSSPAPQAATLAPKPAAPKPAAPAPKAAVPSPKPAAPGIFEQEMQSKLAAWSAAGEEFSEGTCPTCGYYAGASLTCIRCGARVEKRISIRLIKWISLGGAVVGIVLLWLAANAKAPGKVNVADIDEMMNGALVEVDGHVTEYTEDADKNSLRLKVDDGSGEITVSAFNKLAQFKKELGDKMPKLGDEVSVVGTINQTQKFGVSLFLSISERLRLVKRVEVKEMKIGEISSKDVGQIANLKARVSAYESKATKNGGVLHHLVLSDGTGEIDMTIFDNLFTQLPPTTQKLLTEGTHDLEMTVKISAYRQKMQVSLLDAASIKDAGISAGAAPTPSVAADTGALPDTGGAR